KADAGHPQIFANRHLFEGGSDLVRTPQSEPGDAVGRQAGDVPAFEGDAARSGAHDAANDVEEGRLAAAVGTDEADDLPGRDVEVDAREGLDAAESPPDSLNDQQGHGQPPDRRKAGSAVQPTPG